MIRNLLKTTRFIALSLTFTLSFNVNAARNYENTWFEIEVILFSQIDDKSKLQEAFPESSNINTPSSVIDLIGPYLAPNISNLKNRLSVCPDYSNNSASVFLSDRFTINYVTFDEQLAEDTANNFYIFNQSVNTTKFNTLNTIIEPDDSLVTSAIEYKLNQQDITTQTTENNELKGYVFNQVSTPQEFCRIPESFFFEYKKENPDFNYNGPALDNIPTLISGEEDLETKRAYLINEESLQLQDIVKQLKRSRNFKPLLHMGWRQITKGPKEAIPLKLYAGENLIQPYNKALADHQRATQSVLNMQQRDLLQGDQTSAHQYDQKNNGELITSLSNPIIDSNKDVQDQLQRQISDILKDAKNVEPELNAILTEINSGPDELVTPVMNSLVTGMGSVTEQKLIEPVKPPQNWTIEGLLKVEVEHFLHITATFNVINMSHSEQATNQLTSKSPIKLKSIRFEQNKRVRSKETHYFDHPYMGIIVQIRRHEQIQPVEEIEDKTQINPIEN